ncbi:uncharacterized protein LOC132637336 [Lycium barbarum]|uniref:uncharacterized protein LOC132637336 n=1 Tax=Lycium barbarum TaxID=112863 RepID=UPI00293EFA87|nr:uncharacterized protein LOC132637336 [Lycium barbarum]
MKISKRFCMPDIPKYNGTTDLNENVTAYTCAIKGNDLADDERESVLLKKFGEILSKGAMIWYHNLPEHSIDSFAMLADAFVKAHAGAIEAFTKGLNARSSIISIELKQNLIEYPAIAWADVHTRYQSNIRVEDNKILRDALVSWHSDKGRDHSRRVVDRDSRSSHDRYQPYPLDRRGNGHNSESGKNDRRNDRRNGRGQNSRGLINRNAIDRAPGNKETPTLSEYNFCVDVATIAAAVIRNKERRHSRPIQSDPEKRDKSLICKYHHTHGHRTEDCRQLREEVARLFNLGHLREFLSERAKTHFKNLDSNKQDRPEEPQQVIHMIMGGTDVPIGPVVKRTKISITREKRIRNDDPDGPITFNDEDMEGIAQPYNDALIRSYRQYGSSTDSTSTKGEITLPINMAGTAQQIKFYVIEGDMGYNALLDRPWIHLMRAVPSTMHQVLKFSTLEGIKIIRGEQQAAKEMFEVEESVKNIKAPDRNEGKDAK